MRPRDRETVFSDMQMGHKKSFGTSTIILRDFRSAVKIAPLVHPYLKCMSMTSAYASVGLWYFVIRSSLATVCSMRACVKPKVVIPAAAGRWRFMLT